MPEESIYQRCLAKIDLSAIEHNFSSLCKRIPESVKKLVVLKADAYGHGAIRVAELLSDRVDYFGVACIEEALTLREAGIKTPILILSYTSPLLFDLLVKENITPTVCSQEDAVLFSCVCENFGKKCPVHVAVDTGMGRIGFAPTAESVKAVAEISRMPGIFLEGVFSHFALADAEETETTEEQSALFDAFLKDLAAEGVNPPVCHISNSAGTMFYDKKYNMCRLGIALYGLSPSDEVDASEFDLRPAMEVVTHVVHVKEVEKGTKIGYGHVYTAPSRRKIATIAIGYADGFRRCLTEKGYVLIHGKRAPLVGKVCMDLSMVDVTDIPDVQVEDEVVILGKSGSEEITAETLGALSHSFHYEVICSFLPRVKRIY